MFRIAFVEDDSQNGRDTAVGRITLGEYSERFQAPLDFWSKDDYEEQWREGRARIVRGMNKSCVVTSMYDPKTANFIECWAFYRVGESIVVQNQLIAIEPEYPLKVSDIYSRIEERSFLGANEKVSEWHLRPRDFS
jgi:hypothetical protein